MEGLHTMSAVEGHFKAVLGTGKTTCKVLINELNVEKADAIPVH